MTRLDSRVKRRIAVPVLSFLLVLFLKGHTAANTTRPGVSPTEGIVEVDQPSETEVIQNTADWFLALSPSELAHHSAAVLPWAIAISIVGLVALRWNERDRPMPASISERVDRWSEWPYWWVVVVASAIPETLLIAVVWGGVAVRHLVLGEPWEVASERSAMFATELVMSVVRPFVEATGWIGVLGVLAFIFFFIGFGFVATPILAYFDLRYIEKNSYEYIPRGYAWRFAMFRVFSMVSYLRMRRRALDGWVATEYHPDISRQIHEEGYSRI